MTSYVETMSLTELTNRKIFLEDQLNIVNDLIDVRQNELKIVQNNLEMIEKEEVGIHKNIEKQKKKIKIKLSKDK